MGIQVLGDTVAKLSALRALLEQHFEVSSGLLREAKLAGDIEAIVVAADLRDVDNVAAIKEVSAKLKQIPRRVFVVDETARLPFVQAYALGATDVLANPVSPARLRAILSEHKVFPADWKVNASGREQAAEAGAFSIRAMFRAILSNAPVDVKGTKDAGQKIADSISEHGLKDWLATVRRHHEGTYQHCLLVTGVAVDFGLHLGMGPRDIERLYSAAMFHDIGKARIPLAVLEKPGRLDALERALIETHPVGGFEALKGTAGISPEVLDAVRHHHEYLDGSGYPDALCGQSISDIVRVLTIADIFAALVEERPYRGTMSREDAYEIIKGMKGKLERPLVSVFREVALTR
jgi:putative nucleotidyltransferase with HDIG domain